MTELRTLVTGRVLVDSPRWHDNRLRCSYWGTGLGIAADGSLSNRRIWAETSGDHPDGICLDTDDSGFSDDVGSTRCVQLREEGEVLREITLDRAVSTACWAARRAEHHSCWLPRSNHVS